MCDMMAPVKSGTARDIGQCYTQDCQHQSTHNGPRDRRARVGTDDDGDQFRPAPVPGPGRGSQRSGEPTLGAVPVESRGTVAVVVQDAARAWSDDMTEDDAQLNLGEGKARCKQLADLRNGASHKIKGKDEVHREDTVVSESHLKKDVPSVHSDKFLKPVNQLQRHSSESSADSGCSCSCAAELKELYEENGSLKTRLRAAKTIDDILKKTREEVETLQSKNAKLEIAIGNLQSRLHRVGCDTSVDLAEHEIFIPGHDRVFVNNLISENGRLQKELKEFKTRGDAVRTSATLEKEVEELKPRICKLQEQLRIKEERILSLEKLLKSSEDAKTSKIIHLEDVCLRTSKDLKIAEDNCETLSSETKRLQGKVDSLQGQLSKTSEELVSWKEKAQHLESRPLAVCTQKMEVQKESNLSTSDRLKIAEGQVEQLDKENSRLTEQLREVIGMNTRWQRYNEQRETHVLKLTKTNQHQHSKITVLEQQQRDLEQTINGLNVMLQQLKDEQKKNTDAAIISLEQQLAQREDRIVELTEEVSALKMYVQTTENDRGIQQRKEDKDMIETLQQQVQIFKDDFEQERRDRERIQGNNEILRHRLQDTSRKLAALELQNSRTASNFSAKVVGSAPVYEQQPRRLLARGLSRPRDYGFDDDSFLPFEVEVDGQDETDGPGSNSEPLQCPRCAQEFAVADHSLFMRHVGICLDQ